MEQLVPLDARDVPPEQALLVVDMKGYSQFPEAKMAPVRSDLDDILATVFAQSGLANERSDISAYKDTGDGAIFVLPAKHTARLIDPLLGNLNAALIRYDKYRLASAPAIRLRASVHVGPLSLPDHRGDAINEACRLIDSDAARQAMDAAVEHSAFLAAVISETAYRRTVGAGRTQDVEARHLLPATARVEGKPGFEEPCRILVPQLGPEAIRPYIKDSSNPPSGSAGAVPPQAPTPTSPGSAAMFQFNAPVTAGSMAGTIDTVHIDQRGR
ncbi:hypothetical protein BGM19_26680 [Streptomyces agglomeratus]|uniref:hypothetical protein n=1 Tax=Streptomyces agglomeratus TaxID=285458 RepID=UPI00086A8CAD|nr:hypothetical protein [Streptomyces agglomeratus]OEJ61063.1 hypothetical protein BGM19_26680 [Streptomyces agglomeratus]